MRIALSSAETLTLLESWRNKSAVLLVTFVLGDVSGFCSGTISELSVDGLTLTWGDIKTHSLGRLVFSFKDATFDSSDLIDETAPLFASAPEGEVERCVGVYLPEDRGRCRLCRMWSDDDFIKA